MSSIAELAAAALAADLAAKAAAATQATADLVAAARTTIGTTLTPLNPSSLTVAHTDTASGVVVLTDGTVCLSVKPTTSDICLVRNQDGWTRVAGPLHSLAELGQALAADA